MSILIYCDGWNIAVITGVARVRITPRGFHAYSFDDYIGYFINETDNVTFKLRGV